MMASLRKRGKIWYYRFIDADGIPRERKGCPDRRATEDMARQAETEAGRVRAGLIDPRDVAYREHETRPLAEPIAEFRAALLAKGVTEKHARLSFDRVRRLVALVRGIPLAEISPPRSTKRDAHEAARQSLDLAAAAARLSDLAPSRVQEALATLR